MLAWTWLATRPTTCNDAKIKRLSQYTRSRGSHLSNELPPLGMLVTDLLPALRKNLQKRVRVAKYTLIDEDNKARGPIVHSARFVLMLGEE